MEQDKLKLNLQFFAEGETDDEEETIDPTESQDEEAGKATLDDLQADLDEANVKVVDLANQLSESQNKYNELLEKVKALAIELGIVSEIKSETSELAGDKAALEDKIAELQGTISTLTTENESLAAQVRDLEAEAAKVLVDKVIAKKLELGDIAESDVETERAKLAERSKQSLLDTLDDLSRRKVTRHIEKVANPALADNSQNGVISTKNEMSDEQEEAAADIDEKFVFRNLFTGRREIPTKIKGGNK